MLNQGKIVLLSRNESHGVVSHRKNEFKFFFNYVSGNKMPTCSITTEPLAVILVGVLLLDYFYLHSGQIIHSKVELTVRYAAYIYPLLQKRNLMS